MKTVVEQIAEIIKVLDKASEHTRDIIDSLEYTVIGAEGIGPYIIGGYVEAMADNISEYQKVFEKLHALKSELHRKRESHDPNKQPH